MSPLLTTVYRVRAPRQAALVLLFSLPRRQNLFHGSMEHLEETVVMSI